MYGIPYFKDVKIESCCFPIMLADVISVQISGKVIIYLVSSLIIELNYYLEG